MRPDHVKPRLLDHWGTSPGLNLLVGHVNRVTSSRNLRSLFVTGPPAIVSGAWLDGSWTEAYPGVLVGRVGIARVHDWPPFG